MLRIQADSRRRTTGACEKAGLVSGNPATARCSSADQRRPGRGRASPPTSRPAAMPAFGASGSAASAAGSAAAGGGSETTRTFAGKKPRPVLSAARVSPPSRLQCTPGPALVGASGQESCRPWATLANASGEADQRRCRALARRRPGIPPRPSPSVTASVRPAVQGQCRPLVKSAGVGQRGRPEAGGPRQRASIPQQFREERVLWRCCLYRRPASRGR